MNEHEVYSNAPVVLVALEIRHPASDSLTPSEVRAIKERLSKHTPIARSAQLPNIHIIAGAATAASAEIERFTKFVNRQSTLAISFRREALIVETSVYPGWIDFRQVVSDAIDARMEIAPIDGVERVGIRYIDEIRLPATNGDSIDWDLWVNPSLLGPRPTLSIDLPLSQWQGIGVYGGQPGHQLVLRYGPHEGFAVDPSNDLKRAKPTAGGKFFLMDIDSYWTPEDEIPEVERDVLIGTCNEFHSPVRTLFEGLIQNKLRDEVFRS